MVEAKVRVTMYVNVRFKDLYSLAKGLEMAEKLTPEDLVTVRRGSDKEFEYAEAIVEGVSR